MSFVGFKKILFHIINILRGMPGYIIRIGKFRITSYE